MDFFYFLSFAVLLLSLFLLTRENKMKRMRNLPPSPLNSLPILGHLGQLKGKPLHQTLGRLSTRHGPLLLLHFGTRPVLLVSSAQLANECFTTNDLAFANRPKLSSIRLNTYNHSAFVFAPYGPLWRDMRRIASTKVLSTSRLAIYSGAREAEAQALARGLFRDSDPDKFIRVELRPRVFGLSMNIIMNMMAGKRYYGEESGDEQARRFREIVEEALRLSGASNICDYLPSLLGWLAGRRVKSMLAGIHKYRDGALQALIEEHRRKINEDKRQSFVVERENRSETMLDSLLILQKTNQEKYNDTFIKALIMSLLSGGTDTSSNAIEWAMSLLLNNPEKLEKLREEIDGSVEKGRIVNESDLSKLSYLRCIINETLRLYPIVPLLVPHESLDECTVGGYNIPKGIMLLVNVYSIQRDPNLWSDPTRFIPERFMSSDIKLARGAEGVMFPFGIGRRSCPGEELAKKEVGLVIAILTQCFEWARVSREEVDMEEEPGLTMPKANPLQALFKPRHSMIEALSQL